MTLLQNFLFFSIVLGCFAGSNSLGWRLWSLRVCCTSNHFFCFSESPWEVRYYLNRSTLYVTCSFSMVGFNIFSLLRKLSVWLLRGMGILFSGTIYLTFCNLLVPFFISIFFRFEILFYDFVKNILWAFEQGFFSFLYSYYSWVWCYYSLTDILDVLCQKIIKINISFNQCIHFSIISSEPEILSYISCIVLVKLASVVSILFNRFHGPW